MVYKDVISDQQGKECSLAHSPALTPMKPLWMRGQGHRYIHREAPHRSPSSLYYSNVPLPAEGRPVSQLTETDKENGTWRSSSGRGEVSGKMAATSLVCPEVGPVFIFLGTTSCSLKRCMTFFHKDKMEWKDHPSIAFLFLTFHYKSRSWSVSIMGTKDLNNQLPLRKRGFPLLPPFWLVFGGSGPRVQCEARSWNLAMSPKAWRWIQKVMMS